ncbi:VOC family protein [Jiangella muralis]|uniref:VOC family protein n=1 Tax=Jiangella muralis TaxID=702383 RepID=UPI00069FE506|nr:VOC family protein [Jiangella muralis]
MSRQNVPEPKTSKNRVHLDVRAWRYTDASGGRPPEAEVQAAIAAKVDELVAAGATVGGTVEQYGNAWTVLHDPEGNEFCVV